MVAPQRISQRQYRYGRHQEPTRPSPGQSQRQPEGGGRGRHYHAERVPGAGELAEAHQPAIGRASVPGVIRPVAQPAVTKPINDVHRSFECGSALPTDGIGPVRGEPENGPYR